MLLDVCASTVSYPDRFAQTGTDRVLRELSIADRERVIESIDANMRLFSREGLRFANAKLPERQQRQFCDGRVPRREAYEANLVCNPVFKSGE